MRPASRLLALAPLALCVCKPAAPVQPSIDTSIPAAEPASEPASNAEAEPVPPSVVYGHVRIPSPTGFIEQIRKQLLPPAQRMMFGESSLRTIIGMQLGERAAVAQNVDLRQPMGCVVTSTKRYDRPVACAVAYDGGLPRLVEDLGPDGYVSGGDGHAAYRIQGEPLYLSAMGSHVAVAFAPDLSAAVRDRLQRDIIDAPVGEEDIVGRAFPAAIFEDIPERVEEFIESAARPSSGAPPLQQAQVESQRQQFMSFGDLDRADLWLDLAPERTRLGYRGTAQAGTKTAAAYAKDRQLPADDALVKMLPEESFMVASMRFDPVSFADDPVFGSSIQAMSSMDGSGAAIAMAEAYRQSISMWGELATGHAVVGLLHEEGTMGGLVMAYRLKPDVQAVKKLREVFERMAKAEQALAPVSIDVRPKAIRLGKVRGDLAVIRASAQMQATLKADGTWSAMTKALGGPPQLQLAYAQRDDVLYMVFSLREAKGYLRRTLDAGKGKRSLGQDSSAMRRVEPHLEASMYMLVDVRRTIDWLVRVGAMELPPGPVGGDLDDVVLTMRAGDDGQREVWMDVSQSLIDSLLALAG